MIWDNYRRKAPLNRTAPRPKRRLAPPPRAMARKWEDAIRIIMILSPTIRPWNLRLTVTLTDRRLTPKNATVRIQQSNCHRQVLLKYYCIGWRALKFIIIWWTASGYIWWTSVRGLSMNSFWVFLYLFLDLTMGIELLSSIDFCCHTEHFDRYNCFSLVSV